MILLQLHEMDMLLLLDDQAIKHFIVRDSLSEYTGVFCECHSFGKLSYSEVR